jgi:hypothetical protein
VKKGGYGALRITTLRGLPCALLTVSRLLQCLHLGPRNNCLPGRRTTYVAREARNSTHVPNIFEPIAGGQEGQTKRYRRFTILPKTPSGDATMVLVVWGVV